MKFILPEIVVYYSSNANEISRENWRKKFENTNIASTMK